VIFTPLKLTLTRENASLANLTCKVTLILMSRIAGLPVLNPMCECTLTIKYPQQFEIIEGQVNGASLW